MRRWEREDGEMGHKAADTASESALPCLSLSSPPALFPLGVCCSCCGVGRGTAEAEPVPSTGAAVAWAGAAAAASAAARRRDGAGGGCRSRCTGLTSHA